MALQQMAVSGTIWIVLLVIEYVELKDYIGYEPILAPIYYYQIFKKKLE